mmetsp:Transcript_2207/g.1570  ORF Transcript_2207/g.1570 Transcript_2207/m.1570 type:complete len:124 (-) Transcript_2207:515-886(-)
MQGLLEQVARALRPLNSFKIMIQPLCDTLMMYARTDTYFTPNQGYMAVSSNERIDIRKSDAKRITSGGKKFESQAKKTKLAAKKNAVVPANSSGTETPVKDPHWFEKPIYTAIKRYEGSHIWG